MKKLIPIIVLCAVFLIYFPKSSFATQFDLIAPSGTLTRGQAVQFTVNVDTQGSSLSTAEIGMTYDTQYLQYVSAVPGDAMTSVSVSQPSAGKLVLDATNSSGYTGSGSFAVVTFNLIAQAPGSTELCALYQVTSPTAAPTSTTSASSPQPTSLPKTGENGSGNMIGILGALLVAATIGTLAATRFLDNRTTNHINHQRHPSKKI